MENKKEYLAGKAFEYDQLKRANKMALKLEKKIAEIRGLGYKLIVLGSKVKITIAK